MIGVRDIDRFLEQCQMDAGDLHRPFQMHHSFSVAIYAIPGSMAGVAVVCAGPSRAMPSLWAAATYLRTVHRIPGKAGAHRGLPLAVPRMPTAEVRQWSPIRLPEWTNDPENLVGSS